MSNMNHVALQRIALPSDYGIHADTKLNMFGIFSAAMNVSGVKFSWGYCLFSVVTIYKRVLWL